MVRINLISPQILTDEHLYAERVEIMMCMSFVLKHSIGFIPDKYCLGKGHMSFFRNKYDFLLYRLNEVLSEISIRRNEAYDKKYVMSSWKPNNDDIILSSNRIISRLKNPIRKRNSWHYYGKEILCIDEFITKIYKYL